MARHAHIIAAAAGILMGCFGVHAALADHRPVIALPGNPEVPVTIDGMPADGALVSGDWGLYAPGRVVPSVLEPAAVPADPVFAPYAPRGYFPRTGHRPRYGRQEVLVPRRPLPPAPSYHKSWSSESPSDPVADNQPYNQPIDYPPDNGGGQNQQGGGGQNQQGVPPQGSNRRDADNRNHHDGLRRHLNRRFGHRGFGHGGIDPEPRFLHRRPHPMPHRRGHWLPPHRGGHS